MKEEIISRGGEMKGKKSRGREEAQGGRQRTAAGSKKETRWQLFVVKNNKKKQDETRKAISKYRKVRRK